MSTPTKIDHEPKALFSLPSHLNADQEFADAVDELIRGGHVTLEGVWGSAFSMVAAALTAHCSGTIVVVLCHQNEIDDFCDALQLFESDPYAVFPALEMVTGERVLVDENLGERLRTIKSLTRMDRPKTIVTCIQALLQPCPDHSSLASHTRLLASGEQLDINEFTRWLAENRYQNTSAVELPGEFSLRGGILDVFANDWMHPVRIELFGDEIESIRRFDVADQKSIQSLQEIEITVGAESETGNSCFSVHLPEDTWIVFVEPSQIVSEAKHFLERVVEQINHYLSYENVFQSLASFARADLASIAADTAEITCRIGIESVERFSGEIGKVRGELDELAEDCQVHMVAETQAEIARLSQLLESTNTAESQRLHFVEGRLNSGFRMINPATIVISGNELFHRVPLKRMPKRRLGKAIDSFLELREGDLVVHLAHGIGRYRGLELIRKEGQVEEHLKLEFYGGTKIFVPSSRIELVQKYVGGRKAQPRLATIGGKNWLKQKKAAESAVQDLAADLLKLQAERELQPGISFGHETEWQQEFDAEFPYTETTDQLRAIDAVKSDMITGKPMDRLICGDVGFGKTEIAMRAAFKAVDNGFQVAVLVPTTILAEQHYRTFHDRMAEFPFRIAKLSRFCSAADQRATIKDLKAGAIDIVIGTHRLASKDVAFANLGLLVIDEEQRFGVEVKERLKTIRSSVDVLTLSATPIPRTLHMSLTGIRDISNLETPPEDRTAVETRVTRWGHDLIRNAVLRELNRGGQIYFVHNRIHDIETVQKKLCDIVPEATIRIGHGQMPEGQLEQVMVDFVNQGFDILLATTIIESGLDIPNANTIFIDDAHQYGLADLHQLRGRVGRYKNRAYCYLLVNPNKSLTPNAARRLRAIEEFSDMGAGFAIAMRDLEIRGAGNILGTQQSGHIALIGYELYCQLLEAAVRRLKNLPPKMQIDVTIDLPGEAFLPRDYIPSIRIKIDIYRRLARCAGDRELNALKKELVDRFGHFPECVRRLFTLAELKTDAAVWQINSIFVEDKYLVFKYLDRSRANQLSRQSQGKLRVVDEDSIYLTIPEKFKAADDIIALAKNVLQG